MAVQFFDNPLVLATVTGIDALDVEEASGAVLAEYRSSLGLTGSPQQDGVQLGWDQFGQPMAHLVHESGTTVDILLHGNTPVGFRTADGFEVYHMSSLSQHGGGEFDPLAPVRGGAPLCFPAMGGDAPGGVHGFGRVHAWTPVPTDPSTQISKLALQLTHDDLRNREELPDGWDQHEFVLKCTHGVGANSHSTRLSVQNTGSTSFELSLGSHDYLKTINAYGTEIHGLEGARCVSAIGLSTWTAQAPVERTEGRSAEGPVNILRADWGPEGHSGPREVDARFYDVKRPVEVHHHADQTVIKMTRIGLPHVHLWNPGAAKARNMGDYDNDGYPRHVCVEACIEDRHVEPGETVEFGKDLVVEAM